MEERKKKREDKATGQFGFTEELYFASNSVSSFLIVNDMGENCLEVYHFLVWLHLSVKDVMT